MLNPLRWLELRRWSVRVLSRKIQSLESELAYEKQAYDNLLEHARASDSERHRIAEAYMALQRKCGCRP